jgi:hypothetical protein
MNNLKFKELVRDGGLQNAQVDPISRVQLLGLEFPQPIFETPQTLQFGIEREPTEIIRATVVFVKSETGGEKGAGVEIPFDEFFRHSGKLNISILRSIDDRRDNNKAEHKKSIDHLAETGR